jgi:hypothetical protein
VNRPLRPGLLPGIAGAEAVFSPCGSYRYRLERRWDLERPLCVWIMLNPSLGDAWRMDPTLWRVYHFSQGYGAGGFLVVNLYAYVSPSPHDLVTVARAHLDPEGPDNREHLRSALLQCTAPGVHAVAAWGNVAHGSPAASAFLRLAALRGVELSCLGLTRSGAPRHPLHAPRACPLLAYAPSRSSSGPGRPIGPA